MIFLIIQDLVLGLLGLVLGNDFLHLTHYRHVVEGVGELQELFLVLLSQLVGILAHLGYLDLGMDGGDGCLGVVEDFPV